MQPNAANVLTTLALGAIAVGCWMERPSLALLVPGTIVFVALAVTRLRERG